jgi:AcrR family transcriptional regulator
MTNSEPMATVGADRRSVVLSSALSTFARFGYRKTSMDEIARAAHISRPGLYFLFASKEDLFRAAVVQGLEDDLAHVERTLGESDRPIRERLLEAFDRWAGRYIGPMSRDITSVVDENPELLGEIVVEMPQRFADLVTRAFISAGLGLSAERSTALVQTMISTSIGIKHQVEDRVAYGDRLAVAIDLLVR